MITTTTVMPRQGTAGIGRSNSRGGSPCTLSSGVGVRKNKRGSRRMRLKLEVDEGIAASLSKNDGARHQGPGAGHGPAWHTRDRCFDVAIAEKRVHQDHAGSDYGYLQHLARGKNRVAARVSPEHPA